MMCQHWTPDGYCGAADTRHYMPGPRCPAHTPAALHGRPEAIPDPALTLDALYARKDNTR